MMKVRHANCGAWARLWLPDSLVGCCCLWQSRWPEAALAVATSRHATNTCVSRDLMLFLAPTNLHAPNSATAPQPS